MRIKAPILFLASLFGIASACAETKFDEVFSDSTLRLDYVLSGRPGDTGISLKNMRKYAGWAGRKVNMDKLQYAGNGDITVTTIAGDTIYRNSFSSLFNEWLDLNDDCAQSCESPLLIPMPKDTVSVTVNLLNKYHKPIATMQHMVVPSDILIRNYNKQPLLHKYIRKGNAAGQHIGVAFLAEGYTDAEMEQFYKDAEEAVDAISEHQPFTDMIECFDFIAVETPSAESGVSVPKLNQWKNTAFDSHFSTFYSDRYLTAPSVFKMYDAIEGIPVQHLIVLANIEEYGGGGIFNAYTLTAAHHPKYRPVVVHEFGHSFGGLADEYFYEVEVMSDTYPTDVEPWEPNITTLCDFDSKWKSLLKEGTPIPTNPKDSKKYPVGVYEGGGYSFHGIYRPADNCRMRINEIDHFCPACQNAMKKLILFYTQEQ